MMIGRMEEVRISSTIEETMTILKTLTMVTTATEQAIGTGGMMIIGLEKVSMILVKRMTKTTYHYNTAMIKTVETNGIENESRASTLEEMKIIGMGVQFMTTTLSVSVEEITMFKIEIEACLRTQKETEMITNVVVAESHPRRILIHLHLMMT